MTPNRLPRRFVLSPILVLVLALTIMPLAGAQEDPSVLAAAVEPNRTYVSQIESALTATDIATLQAGASAALGTGSSLEAFLSTVEQTATDDATRSRAEGLLRHIEAAQDSLRRALTQTEFEAARSDVDAALGEAIEALSEVVPFEGLQPAEVPTEAPAKVTPSVATPVVPADVEVPALPAAGGPTALLLIPLVLIGIALLALGNRVRRG